LILEENLSIMWRKAMDKEVVEQIKKKRKKGRKTFITLTTIERLVERELAKQQANFIATWSSIVVRKVGDIINLNFKEGM